MSEIKYFLNFKEYREYNLAGKKKLETTKYILIDLLYDNIQQVLVFTLSNNTAYFFCDYELLKDDKVLPKTQYSLIKLMYNGCHQRNNPLNAELISTSHNDYFSFNRNNYIEIVVKDFKKSSKYQLKMKIVYFEDIEKPKKEGNILYEIFDENELDLLNELITEYRNVQNVNKKFKEIQEKMKVLKILSEDPDY